MHEYVDKKLGKVFGKHILENSIKKVRKHNQMLPHSSTCRMSHVPFAFLDWFSIYSLVRNVVDDDDDDDGWAWVLGGTSRWRCTCQW